MKYLSLLFLSLFLLFNNSKAAIVHTDLMPDSIVNMTIDPTFGTGSGSNLSILDVNNDGTSDFDFRYNVSPGFGWFLHIVELNGSQIVRTTNNSTTISNPYATLLNSNDFIGSSSNWSSAVEPLIGDTTDYNFGGQGDQFIGIKLVLAGNEHFGWVKVSFDNTASPKQLVIKEYAFEDVAGTPIAAGQVSGPPPIPEIVLTQDDTLYNTVDTLTFPLTPSGNTVNRTFKIKNIGTTDLIVTDFLISTGNTADFSVNPPSDSIIAPDDSINFTVSFSPNVTGPRASLLTFNTNDGDESNFSIVLNGEGDTGGGGGPGGASGSIIFKYNGVEIPNNTGLFNFGQVTVGMDSTVNFIICNTDTIDFVDIDFLDVFGFGGTTPFTTSVSAPVTILAGDSLIMPVTFTPTFNGIETAQVSAFSFSSMVGYQFEISGEGIGGTTPPGLTLTESSVNIPNSSIYDFGNIPLGSTVTKNFILKANGLTSSISIDFLDVFGFTGGTEFSTTLTAPITLGLGDSIIIPISYTPSAIGVQDEASLIIFPDFNSGVSDIQIELKGQAVNAELIQSLDAYAQGNATEINTPSGTLQMLVDILPITATNQVVNWTVDDNSIAMINSSGVLQAISNGTVTVTATSTDGSGMSDDVEIEMKNQTTSIANSESSSLKIYPNPSSKYIHIETDLNIEKASIISVTGKILKSSEIKENKIDIEFLTKGLYYISLFDLNGKKLVSTFTKK